MKRLRIYLDTSVINFLFADDAPDFRKITEEFFAKYSRSYDLYISKTVLLEMDRTRNVEHRRRLMETVRRYPITVLPNDERRAAIELLVARYIERGIIPSARIEDALHVAFATVFEMDILLSWNFKHLANVNKEAKILTVNSEEGYRYPLRLLSPLEVESED